jgi:hypothetical protein
MNIFMPSSLYLTTKLHPADTTEHGVMVVCKVVSHNLKPSWAKFQRDTLPPLLTIHPLHGILSQYILPEFPSLGCSGGFRRCRLNHLVAFHTTILGTRSHSRPLQPAIT